MQTKITKPYRHLIFDADHTLLNYLADEQDAFEDLYQEWKVQNTEELKKASRRFSEEVWTRAGLYNVHLPEIQNNYHVLYRSHVDGIFEELFSLFPTLAKKQIPASQAGEKFLTYLERKGTLMTGADEILQRFSKNMGGRYALSIATNGLHNIQTARLSPLSDYVERIFISEDIRSIKPLPAFFAYVLDSLHASADECLMIGDSLSSDVAGAKAMGMDACWLNWSNKPIPENTPSHLRPDYEIHSLLELLDMLPQS